MKHIKLFEEEIDNFTARYYDNYDDEEEAIYDFDFSNITPDIIRRVQMYEKFEDDYSEHDIDAILDSYLECVIWTEDDDEFSEKTIYDFNKLSKKEAKEQIEWFVKCAGDSLKDIPDGSIGHDLWLTRNGHGAGFFDRGYNKEISEHLTELSDILGSIDAFVGNYGKIYFDISSDKYKKIDIKKYKKEREFKNNQKKYNL